jgi:NTE family protein
LVDGALTNPITNVARQLGARFVIAVSVIATDHPAITSGPIASRRRQAVGRWPMRLLARLNMRRAPQLEATSGRSAAVRLALPDGASNLSTVLSKASAMIQANLAAARLRDEPPDYLIVPPVSDIGLFDFHRAAAAIEAGRAATRAVQQVADCRVFASGLANQVAGSLVATSISLIQSTCAQRPLIRSCAPRQILRQAHIF